jgi:hypothetical protein
VIAARIVDFSALLLACDIGVGQLGTASMG